MNSIKLPLPLDTQSIFINEKLLLKSSNLGLLFNKYIYSWQTEWKMEEKNAKNFRQAVSKIKYPDEYINNLVKRQKALINGLRDSCWYVESFEGITDSRLIIGLGGASVIETGMTLHPLYGFPYLPGSGLKGLARAYAEIVADFQNEQEKKNLLREVFGSEDKDPHHVANNRQGKVFFMDGIPVKCPKIELDIMNPHYGDYYQGKKDSRDNIIPPGDYLDPNPITFLTVTKGQRFSFALLSRERELIDKAEQWLIGGLTELGAGGKTNVGYGYFKIDEIGTKDKGIATQPKEKQMSSFLTKETLTWENATLTFNPGNKMLKATKDNLKAEGKIDKKDVPESLHKKLFDKRKPVIANVIVEKVGNAFKIIKIYTSSPLESS